MSVQEQGDLGVGGWREGSLWISCADGMVAVRVWALTVVQAPPSHRGENIRYSYKVRLGSMQWVVAWWMGVLVVVIRWVDTAVLMVLAQVSFGLQRSAPGAHLHHLRAALRVLPVIGEQWDLD